MNSAKVDWITVYFSTNTRKKTLSAELCLSLGVVDRSTVEKCEEAQAAYGGPARDPFTGAPYREAESCVVTYRECPTQFLSAYSY
jgi:hypothetical protein